MRGNLTWLAQVLPKWFRSRPGAKPPARWRFKPQSLVCLEQRMVPSTLMGTTDMRRDSAASVTAPPDRTASSLGITELHNVPFPTVNGQSELLDVYKPTSPATAGGRPVIVAIHGGGWRRLSKAGYGSRVAAAFVRDGYVVVAPDYALSAPGRSSWPENLEDVQAAVRWVRTNAGTLGINPNEIVAMGESAGANLAALLGTSSTESSGSGVSAAVDAVVASSTPTDLTSLFSQSRLAGLAAGQFLGGSPEQVPASYVAASPADQVSPGDPPMLLIHGRQDPLIPVSQSRELQAALNAAGVRNELILVNGGHNLDFPPQYPQLIPKVLAFLDATWNDSTAGSP
jgi:acetyl esterase/lipase